MKTSGSTWNDIDFAIESHENRYRPTDLLDTPIDSMPMRRAYRRQRVKWNITNKTGHAITVTFNITGLNCPLEWDSCQETISIADGKIGTVEGDVPENLSPNYSPYLFTIVVSGDHPTQTLDPQLQIEDLFFVSFVKLILFLLLSFLLGGAAGMFLSSMW